MLSAGLASELIHQRQADLRRAAAAVRPDHSGQADGGRRNFSVAVLLPFVLVSFSVNSLVTRHVVARQLLDAGLLSAARFISGALALVAIAVMRRERLVVGVGNFLPALHLGGYAICISYGYRYIGAAAGTFVFYATVLLTLVGSDLHSRVKVPIRRLLGALTSLVGVAVLASGSTGSTSLLGVGMLAVTGAAWSLYTVAGRGVGDPRAASTGNFVILAAVLLGPAAAGVAAGWRVTAAGLIWAAAIGVGTTACAYVAWYICQRSISATSAGSVQLVVPVLTAVGAVVLLGEELTPGLLVAAVLVAAGIWLGRPTAATLHTASRPSRGLAQSANPSGAAPSTDLHKPLVPIKEPSLART
jgi:drug/metabolite transporter (DMT)-like permease